MKRLPCIALSPYAHLPTLRIMNYMLSFLVLLVSLLMLRIIRKRNTDNSGAHHYPPGPPAIPVLGNIMTIPNTGPWKLFSKLHRDYGRFGMMYSSDSTFVLMFSVQENLSSFGA